MKTFPVSIGLLKVLLAPLMQATKIWNSVGCFSQVEELGLESDADLFIYSE